MLLCLIERKAACVMGLFQEVAVAAESAVLKKVPWDGCWVEPKHHV